MKRVSNFYKKDKTKTLLHRCRNSTAEMNKDGATRKTKTKTRLRSCLPSFACPRAGEPDTHAQEHHALPSGWANENFLGLQGSEPLPVRSGLWPSWAASDPVIRVVVQLRGQALALAPTPTTQEVALSPEKAPVQLGSQSSEKDLPIYAQEQLTPPQNFSSYTRYLHLPICKMGTSMA